MLLAREDENRALVDIQCPRGPHRLAKFETGIGPLWTSELASSEFARLRLHADVALKNGASTCRFRFPRVPEFWTKETVIYPTRGRPCSSGTSSRQLEDTSDAATHSRTYPRDKADCNCARQQIRAQVENLGSTCIHWTLCIAEKSA